MFTDRLQAFFLACASLLTAGPLMAADTPSYPSSLGTGAYFDTVVTQRNHVIEMMLSVLGDKDATREQKGEAVDVLRAFRAKEAIPWLIEHISFSPQKRVKGAFGGVFPCVGALSNIGSPATEPILDRLEQDLPPLDRQSLIFALVLIETRPDFAKTKVEAHLAKAKDEATKQRLRQTIDRLENSEKTFAGQGAKTP